MTRHRTILLTLSLTLATAAVPNNALAGSLLSGYGGPGGGSQAIIGSTLVGGAARGGGGGGGGSSTGTGGGAVPAAPATGSASARGAGGMTGKPNHSSTHSRAAGPRGGHARDAGGASGVASGASKGISPTYIYPGYPRSATGPAEQDSGPLGLTDTDLLLFAIVLGVLAITAGLTRRLARMQHY